MHFARAADREAALDHTGSECGPLEHSTLNLWEGAFDPGTSVRSEGSIRSEENPPGLPQAQYTSRARPTVRPRWTTRALSVVP